MPPAEGMLIDISIIARSISTSSISNSSSVSFSETSPCPAFTLKRLRFRWARPLRINGRLDASAAATRAVQRTIDWEDNFMIDWDIQEVSCL